MPLIATHSSRFHADDLFAVATVTKKLIRDGYSRDDISVIRTRDPEAMVQADYVLDVGFEYEPARGRFDHHMEEGTKTHEPGFPYAAFGLVWDEYGSVLTGGDEAAALVKQKLVWPIDALDNGVLIHENTFENVYPYMIQNMARSFGPTWKEEQERSFDDGFFEFLPMVHTVLDREIAHAAARAEGKHTVCELYENAADKRIIEMDAHYPYEYVLPEYPEPLYIIRPDPAGGTWKVEALSEEPYPNDAEPRKPFPEAWRGKHQDELPDVTGVDGAVFSHRAGFLTVAADKPSARKLARLAVEA